MDPRLGTAVLVVVGIPAVIVGYIYATEIALRAVAERSRGRIRPWLWLLPALLFLVVFLVWPTILTILRSFQGRLAGDWVGFANYSWFFTSADALISVRNSALWVVFLTLITVGLGLLIAVLVDRVRYEAVAWILSRPSRTESSFEGSFVTSSIAVQKAEFMALGMRSEASNTKFVALISISDDRLLMSSG